MAPDPKRYFEIKPRPEGGFVLLREDGSEVATSPKARKLSKLAFEELGAQEVEWDFDLKLAED